MEPPDSRKRISGQQYFNENERQGFANRLHGYARIRRAVAACTGAQRRGQKLHESDVKIAARELGLPILQPEKLRDPAFVSAMEELRPDLGIVIAFRMLPEVVWAMPRLGTFNLHASLLPQYRGAAPINWAIINGESKTGVTTFLLNHEIDKGAILGQVEMPIQPEDNVGTLDRRSRSGRADR